VPAGYSGTPLAKKLGIRAGDTVALVGAPDGFEDELEGLPDGVQLRRRAGGKPEVVLLFTTQARDLERRFPGLAKSVFPDGSLWIAWPKRSARVATDLDENRLRDIGLPHGLVDNKVCAVNEVWSGLRFVWRRENRQQTSPSS
jgi:hypothetical protein